MRRRLLVLALLGAPSAWAQSPPPEPPPEPVEATETAPVDAAPDDVPPDDAPPPDDEVYEEAPEGPLTDTSEFGPLILIESINIVGNSATQTELIRRALPLRPGDVIHASDKRLRDARFKVLALGFFRDVTLAMRKGTDRGQVILDVRVVERGTIILNKLWFGTTDVSPYWVGADIGERNLLGLGIAVGAGFIYAGDGNITGDRPQWAGEVRVADPSILGTRWGVNGAATLVHGSEAYRFNGDPLNVGPQNLRAFPYRRFGGRAGLTYDATALSRITAGVRVEQIVADVPVAPVLEHPNGALTALDMHLDPGSSRVVTLAVGFDRDSRPDPILPHSGGMVAFSAELGSSLVGGDYEFATLLGRWEHYWPVGRGALGVKIAGGLIIGDAPRFDRIHIADVNRMLTPRALGMVLSAAPPLDLLGTRRDKPLYGDYGGAAGVEYAFQLFRGTGKKRVYGGDLFIGGGLWGLGEHQALRARDTSVWNALPIDIFVDAGVRIDTDIGVFEITIANALGRLR